jgi:hypothetical protein
MRAQCFLAVAFLLTVMPDIALAASDVDRYDEHVAVKISSTTLEAQMTRIQNAFRRVQTSWYRPKRSPTAFPTLGR